MKCNANLIEDKATPLAVECNKTDHQKNKIRGGYPIRCLVVDDDRIILKLVANMLTQMGFKKVDTAQDKSELMDRLDTGPYDLVVTDLMMPDMDGYQLTKMIKKEMKDTKVIIMTGHHRDNCREMMATQWVDGWLFKPFVPNGLYNMLNQFELFECINATGACAHHPLVIENCDATKKENSDEYCRNTN